MARWEENTQSKVYIEAIIGNDFGSNKTNSNGLCFILITILNYVL